MGNPNQFDWGGEDLVVKSITFSDTPGGAQTALSSGEVSVLDGVTAGTATASKAVVLGASKNIATITSATITTLTSTTVTPTTIAGAVNFTGTPTLAAGITNTTGTITLGAGSHINLDSETQACTGTGGTSTATMTKDACQLTTASTTTASGASHVITVTYTGVASTDLVWVTIAGGTNTRQGQIASAVCTTDTITITLYNTNASAVNGTVIMNVLRCQA